MTVQEFLRVITSMPTKQGPALRRETVSSLGTEREGSWGQGAVHASCLRKGVRQSYIIEIKPLLLKFQEVHEKIQSFAKKKIIPWFSKDPEWGSRGALVAWHGVLCSYFILPKRKSTIQFD